jgi:NTE family protein
VPVPRGLPRNIDVKAAHILPHHVLASAAIPIVFPPVFIKADLFCDGGLRLNTPLSPALHLGADRVLVIGMSTHPESARPELAMGRFPGLSFLLGKVLDAFLLDHVNFDVEELELVNQTLRDGIEAYGPGFVERTNEVAVARGGAPRRLVEPLVIRPSEDIGERAAAYLRRERVWLGRQLGKVLLRAIDVGEGADSADLASYLLFDGEFARGLIELGRRDAAARHDELEAFLYGRR